ncbi:hypothetical protein AAFF_G00166830 [Aldrovandia affinis]|uniref:Uncharacterized protein n=1 Tax=Aldrovandia affinis TaxID=143900 RepID=A0AAD7RM64_9TELE|nr:hypothetical protein AAFF_G00166830 [Aldrovandia affinis]
MAPLERRTKTSPASRLHLLISRSRSNRFAVSHLYTLPRTAASTGPQLLLNQQSARRESQQAIVSSTPAPRGPRVDSQRLSSLHHLIVSRGRAAIFICAAGGERHFPLPEPPLSPYFA